VCDSQHGTGEQDTGEQEPQPLQPHSLSLPFNRPPRPSSVLLTYHPPRRPFSATEPPAETEPLPGKAHLSGKAQLPPQQPERAQAISTAHALIDIRSLLDVTLVVLGVLLVVGARITLTRKWAWSWQASPGTTFTLSRMHGSCTSAMGELAQGASRNVASHCLWVDGTWTVVVALGAAGCILAAFGLAHMLRRIRKAA
jgi:hypothetical protein